MGFQEYKPDITPSAKFRTSTIDPFALHKKTTNSIDISLKSDASKFLQFTPAFFNKLAIEEPLGTSSNRGVDRHRLSEGLLRGGTMQVETTQVDETKLDNSGIRFTVEPGNKAVRRTSGWRYAPVILILKTETEFHDRMRELLYYLLRVLKNTRRLSNSPYLTRIGGFAEIISAIAFVFTMPVPPYHTELTVQLSDDAQLVFTESRANELPHKNVRPVKVLFERLDVSSVLHCWKALLLDRKLILLSSQNSLLFYVAEALRELLFPLRWPHSYVLPVPENLLDVLDSPLLYMCGTYSV